MKIGACDESAEAGFTLLELLVALALFALVMSLVPGALQFGRRALEDIASKDRTAEIIGVRGFLEQRLADALPIAERSGTGGMALAFAGGPRSLMFVSPSPRGPDGPGIYRFEVAEGATGQKGTKTIVMRQGLYAPGGLRGALEERVLLANVGEYKFRYFGTVESKGPRLWRDNWVEENRLPELIELSISLLGWNAPRNQMLLIRPRLREVEK